MGSVCDWQCAAGKGFSRTSHLELRKKIMIQVKDLKSSRECTHLLHNGDWPPWQMASPSEGLALHFLLPLVQRCALVPQLL